MSTVRATSWSVTINNPTEADEECIFIARSRGWIVIGQKEKGKEGTVHYQLMVKTPQVRFSAVKKMFPRAHIEVARNEIALQSYVAKQETRVSGLPTSQEQYPSVAKYWQLIYRYFTEFDDKEGLDMVELAEGDICFYREDRENLFQATPLALLDEATRYLILKGYYVEHHACNPQVRQQWKLFARELLARAHQQMSQTDRQTDSVQMAEIPVAQDDITNADGDSSSQASSGLLGGEHDHEEGSGTEAGSAYEEGSTEDC